MRLFLSFTGLFRYWRDGQVDFEKDLFYFGCGPCHVFGEVGSKEKGTPWSEWIEWFKVDPETCGEIQARLVKAEQEGRVGFSYNKRPGATYGQIKKMLLSRGVTPPKPERRLLWQHHNYPQVQSWLEGTIECLY